eukprot:jgi/Astpho2/4410/Aster-00028
MLRQAARQVLGKVKTVQQRCYAETAVAKQLDWDSLEDTLGTDEARREVATLRSTYMDVERRFKEMSKAPEQLNWAGYQDKVDAELLSSFQKAFQSLDFPTYDASAEAQEASKKFEPLLKQAEEVAQFSAKRMSEIEAELKEVDRSMEKVATATIDEELAADPKTAAEIDEEIRKGDFMP